MSQDRKKPTTKKKTSGIKGKDKFKEKVKVPGTFQDLFNMAITPKAKKK